jgi:hypothetical protein
LGDKLGGDKGLIYGKYQKIPPNQALRPFKNGLETPEDSNYISVSGVLRKCKDD